MAFRILCWLLLCYRVALGFFAMSRFMFNDDLLIGTGGSGVSSSVYECSLPLLSCFLERDGARALPPFTTWLMSAS